jgi:hypothetical protein
MGRPLKTVPGGIGLLHAEPRERPEGLVKDESNYAACERILAAACHRVPMCLAVYCLTPDRWYPVLWPHGDGELSRLSSTLLSRADRGRTLSKMVTDT